MTAHTPRCGESSPLFPCQGECVDAQLRVGALFAGYGGLDLALADVLDARVEWVSEYEPPTPKVPTPLQGAARILAHRFPGVPNLGDVTAIDWTSTPPVDVITGGSPCQDVSHAGRRRGMRDGTRSGLWASMVEGIATLQPQLVVWENVRGVLSAEADSGMEPCPGCVGGGDDGAVLRALGRVLGDLADVGFDAGWSGLRAADVGAAHGRFRVFVVAWRRDAATDARGEAVRLGAGLRPGVEGRLGRGRPDDGAVQARRGRVALDVLPLLGTPRTSTYKGPSRADVAAGAPSARLKSQVELLNTPTDLLPTPSTTDGNGARTAEQVATRATSSGGPPRKLNDVAALELFPTPRATDGTKGGPNQRGSSGDLMLPSAVQLLPTPLAADARGARNRTSNRQPGSTASIGDTLGDVVYLDTFGKYAAAIERWERVLGRPAPEPTRPAGKNGARRLSPLFVEWMMGLPEGWVTDPAIWVGVGDSAARNAQLKALGNGVVPQQAAAAIRYLLTVRASALAA